MNKYIKTIIFFLVILLIPLSSCKKDDDDGVRSGEVEFGTFAYSIYTNEWLNVQFTLPQGSRLLSAEELKAEITSSAPVLINDGSYTKEQILQSEASIYYDFALADSANTPCAYLTYIDTNKSSSASISAQNYASGMKEQLASKGSYTLSELGEKNIADAVYVYFTVQSDEHGYTSFYIAEHDHTIIVWTVLNYTAQVPSMDAFMQSITPIANNSDKNEENSQPAQQQ